MDKLQRRRDELSKSIQAHNNSRLRDEVGDVEKRQ
jgi:hypothetical protein